MSGIHVEKAAAGVPRAEIAAMNQEFLRLLTHPALTDQPAALGLDAAVIETLREMTPSQLRRLAGAPLLLADFGWLPGDGVRNSPPDYRDAARTLPPEWLDALHGFANRLLASLWHSSREPDGIAGVCMGLQPHTVLALANTDFAELGRHAVTCCASLRARYASHPRCWPDMVRLACNGGEDQLSAAHLGLIPLTVASLYGGAHA